MAAFDMADAFCAIVIEATFVSPRIVILLAVEDAVEVTILVLPFDPEAPFGWKIVVPWNVFKALNMFVPESVATFDTAKPLSATRFDVLLIISPDVIPV